MTVSFAALPDGTYGGCTITVTDSAGNSVTIYVNQFTIDTIAPVLQPVDNVTTPTNDNATLSYTFSSTEAGTITYVCSGSPDNASKDNNTIKFNPLAEGTYDNCTITVTDSAENTSTALEVEEFKIDKTAPELDQLTAVPTPTDNTTPAYSFKSTEPGTNSYGGSCGSSSTSATSDETKDNVTIILTQPDNSTALIEALYDDCSITVTDSAGNPSNQLEVNTFEVDTTAPTVSSTSPTDNLSSVSVSVSDNISVTFSDSMDNTSVTTNFSNTTCSGYSFQVSSDNFS
ncbi:uncharacterized protein METZ01_LOCUS393146, partial [marine metagenome]